MFALIYASHPAIRFTDDDLHALAVQSSEKNGRLQVTGYLSFNRERTTIFQYLEGPQPAVLELMAAITADERHRIANVIRLDDDNDNDGPRLFPTWHMRYLNASYLRTMQMEDVLEVALLTMCEKTFDRAEIIATVQRLVRHIAQRAA
ncbi:BLUF domain-containing protein [Lacipirellula sp.]|uniref:BLUF domain-containing protein n=1 Tax=Lacipirellula sp. TaxID=2691419 RepID=UPI003D0B45AC